MWGKILSWPGIATIFGILITIAYEAKSTNSNIGKLLLSLSIIMVLLKTMWWMAYENKIEISIKSILSIFIIFGLLGCFWLIAFNLLEADEKEVVYMSEPKLEEYEPHFLLNIYGANIFTPSAAQQLTGILLDVNIRNSGKEASIATNWRLNVILDNKLKLTSQFTNSPDKLTLIGNPSIVVYKTDIQLERDTKNTKLIQGDPPIEGKLLFYVKTLKDEIMKKNTILELSVDDYKGNTFKTSQTLGEWLSSDEISNKLNDYK